MNDPAAAILEKPVSDRGTVGALTQFMILLLSRGSLAAHLDVALELEPHQIRSRNPSE
jgi:hypothetical protein